MTDEKQASSLQLEAEVEGLIAQEMEIFSDWIGTARALWRKWPALVEAAEFPAAALGGFHDPEKEDWRGYTSHGLDPIDPLFREKLMDEVRATHISSSDVAAGAIAANVDTAEQRERAVLLGDPPTITYQLGAVQFLPDSPDGDGSLDVIQEVELTRAEYEALRRFLAELRGWERPTAGSNSNTSQEGEQDKCPEK
jgi:hypothetical protein